MSMFDTAQDWPGHRGGVYWLETSWRGCKMQADFFKRVQKAAESVRGTTDAKPKLGLVLGSGLSGLVDQFPGKAIPFGEIEGYPVATVAGHKGLLKIGDQTAVMAGRFHYYEGHSIDSVVLPIFLLKALGVSTVILTNAAGGIHHAMNPGDIVLLSDHINFLGTNPLMGPNNPDLGPRFPDMSSVYDSQLRELARRLDPLLHEGVYLAVTGPSYETPAEIRAYRALGADLVGMSTVPEAICARYLGMRVLGISVVTNKAAGLGHAALDHKEVVETGKAAEARLSKLITGLTREILGAE